MGKYFNISKLFFWSLGMSAACIPLPGNNFSSISMMVLLFVWVFYLPFPIKLKNLADNRKKLLLMLIPFLLSVVGLIYTDNLDYGLRKVELLLPFVVYPLILFSISKEEKLHRFVMYCFSFGTLMAALIAVSRAVYLKWHNLGEYFYYFKFAELLDKHTTYFSLFVVITSLFLFYETLKKRFPYVFFGLIAVFFVFVLYIVSARISIVALGAGGFILLYYHLKTRFKWVVLLVLPLSLMALFAAPNFQKRFELNQTEQGPVNDYDFRKQHWLSVIETIKHQSILIGGGTGSDRDYLYERYENYKLTAAYLDEYNAHNQFLEILLDYGLMGLSLFVLMLVGSLMIFYKNKDSLALIFLTVFLIFFLTESLLQRQDGVVCFGLIISLFLYRQNKYKSTAEV